MEVEQQVPLIAAKIKEAFKRIVVANAGEHEPAYLLAVCWDQGAAVPGVPSPSLQSGLALSDWADLHLSESAMPLSAWLNFANGEAEVIGEIEGQPVYFNRKAGIYAYASAPDAGIILELWLTSPHYPPGW